MPVGSGYYKLTGVLNDISFNDNIVYIVRKSYGFVKQATIYSVGLAIDSLYDTIAFDDWDATNNKYNTVKTTQKAIVTVVGDDVNAEISWDDIPIGRGDYKLTGILNGINFTGEIVNIKRQGGLTKQAFIYLIGVNAEGYQYVKLTGWDSTANKYNTAETGKYATESYVNSVLGDIETLLGGI